MEKSGAEAPLFLRFKRFAVCGEDSVLPPVLLFYPEVNGMDQGKIGKFIASLRRDAGLTQEALGEKLGVTNKTVSRWETGTYLPDIETFCLLSQIFGVSVSELLAGERLTDERFREKADETLVAAVKESAFSVDERRRWLIQKWRKEHIALFVLLALLTVMAFVLPQLCGKPWLSGLSGLVAFACYGWQNNRMMIYVEARLYGEK